MIADLVLFLLAILGLCKVLELALAGLHRASTGRRSGHRSTR